LFFFGSARVGAADRAHRLASSRKETFGLVEDKRDESYITTNRIIPAAGMSFGGGIAIAVLIAAGQFSHLK
jgi:hypothetical protein